jgi:serine/threonine/tyrosine-interacting protein
MWRTTKTRMSFVYSQSMYLPHTFYKTPNSLARADGFITKALSAGGKVLVHCNGTPFCWIVRTLLTKFTYTPGGISLSPAFVVMFVMRHCHLSWEDALHLVQNRRYCISPNGGFLTQIKVSCARLRACSIFAFVRVLCAPAQRGLPLEALYLIRLFCAQEYESIYKASVAVASFPQGQVQRVVSRRKRGDDDDDEIGCVSFRVAYIS